MKLRCPPKALVCESDSGLVGRFYAHLPAGVRPEDAASIDYFGEANLQTRILRVGDTIEVMPEDMTWYGRLVVRALDPVQQLCKTAWLDGPKMFDGEDIEFAEMAIKYRGQHAKWTIVRGEETIEAGFASKEAAQMRLSRLSQDAAA